MVGHGRNCRCRPKRGAWKLPKISDTTLVWLLVAWDGLALVGTWHLIAAVWRAWS